MIQLIRAEIDPQWMEIRENGVVVQEVEVHFRLWKIPKSFGSLAEVLEWLNQTERKQAKNRAYRLLSSRAYPSSVLKKKLEGAGYSQKLCRELIDELQAAGYIQDEDFWASFVRVEFRKGNGPRLIELKGMVKGMPVHLVRAHISDEMQREKIQSLERKGFQSLLRKGFDSELLVEFFRR
jgi:SOS response regulatory protein OraA/RecX